MIRSRNIPEIKIKSKKIYGLSLFKDFNISIFAWNNRSRWDGIYGRLHLKLCIDEMESLVDHSYNLRFIKHLSKFNKSFKLKGRKI